MPASNTSLPAERADRHIDGSCHQQLTCCDAVVLLNWSRRCLRVKEYPRVLVMKTKPRPALRSDLHIGKQGCMQGLGSWFVCKGFTAIYALAAAAIPCDATMIGAVHHH